MNEPRFALLILLFLCVLCVSAVNRVFLLSLVDTSAYRVSYMGNRPRIIRPGARADAPLFLPAKGRYIPTDLRKWAGCQEKR